MSDPNQESRLAFGSGPVNRRTLPRVAPAPPPLVHDSVRVRLQKTRQRALLGAPISQQLGSPAAVRATRHPLHGALLAAALCAVGTVTLPLLLPGMTGLLAGAGFAVLLLGSLGWYRHSRRAVDPAGSASRSPRPFDAESLNKLDRAFEASAALLSESALKQLIALKAAAVQAADALAQAESGAEFTPDDRLYVVECLRRYIPDTLTAYLQVPTAQRAVADAQTGQSADSLLLQQLALLQAELERRSQKLAAAAIEPLLRQQRFLEAKARQRQPR